MSSLFSILGSTANTLQTFTKALDVSVENVSNVSTPGYTEQVQSLTALPFDPASGLVGGVAAGEIQSTRDIFAEQNVQAQNSQLGAAGQQVSSLTDLQSNFDISGATGIPAAISALSAAFSGWSVSPNDATSRQNVIQNVQDVASAFRTTAANISQIASSNQTQLAGLVGQVNGYAASVAADNAKIQAGGAGDAAVSADLYSNLENLSQVANISTINQPDGTVTVLLGGQATLVAGSQVYPIGSQLSVPATPEPTFPSAPPNAQILDSQGNDITSTVTGGELGGVLTVLNQTLPAIEGDSTQQGSLNLLAQSFADAVNGIQISSNVSDGPPVQAGAALFSYDTSNSTNAAASLTLATGATASGLAAISPANGAGNPPTAEISAGAALSLAGLATAANQVGGQSYTQLFGAIAANVGSALSTATTNQATQTSVLAQARALRSSAQGVDLNQEAVTITQLQASLNAAAKVFTVIDELTQTVINLIN
jgi:flagellar hook-associated protein 1 FlgK